MQIFYFSVILVIMPSIINAQITDDFSDGDFSKNPPWIGSTNYFMVNENGQLQLNDDVAGRSVLALSSTYAADCEWQFWIRLAFSPSANNNARIYLISDQADLDGNVNGYFLQLGETGSGDAIALFKQKGSETTLICRGKEGLIASAFAIRIKIVRNQNGLWQVYADYSGGHYFQAEAGGTDNEHTSSTHFGLLAKYTSSNSKKIFLDDVYIGPRQVDITAPEIISLHAPESNTLEMLFSEALISESAENILHYSVNNGIGNPKQAILSEDFTTVLLEFASGFEKNISYDLEVKNIQDFSGNNMEKIQLPFTYFEIEENDIVINEILFHPLNGCDEYLEIYNRSSKVLDLKKLLLCRIKEDYPNPPDTSFAKITTNTVLMQAQEYLVLTKSPETVKKYFYTENPQAFLQMDNFPALINDEGHLLLMNEKNSKIDELEYAESMHHPLLNYVDGVALERVHFDASGAEKSNWHSAASSAGYGTPGYQNSQFSKEGGGSGIVRLSPEIFSPDNDGKDDVLNIHCVFQEAGLTANIFIFNPSGQRIKHLIKNQTLSTEEQFFWNGRNDDDKLMPMGIYIIYVEVFNTNGNVKKYKETTVLAGTLN